MSEVAGWKVLLLEAGGDETLVSDIPSLCPFLTGSELDWKYRTEPNPDFCRGKILPVFSIKINFYS